MSHPFDKLPLNNNAGLIFTPCPGTKNTSIADAIATLKDAGATALITLMPTTELESLQVLDIAQHCKAAGLAWFHCPIADDHAPEQDFAAAWQVAAPQVHQQLIAGHQVAIHCKGGSGRTGLMAAQILYERGLAKDVVTSKIQALRPYALTLAPHVQYFTQLNRENTQAD